MPRVRARTERRSGRRANPNTAEFFRAPRVDSIPVPEGRLRCPVCGRDVLPRADGQMRAHHSAKGVTCPGAAPANEKATRALMCEHGFTRNERKANCGCPSPNRRTTGK